MKRILWIGLLVSACSGGDSGEITAKSKIVNPETCKDCHPNHYDQWRGSMHAYAADDPVFLAMNERGQRETNGELGDFCVKCHAPMAVELGLTKDGLNLPDLPQQVKGVTCYFCHNVTEVEGTHNNPLLLAMDRTMRGPISDPFDGGFHEAAYSAEQDGRTLKSGDMCGACHDIVTPAGVHLERTYTEWLFSFYSNPDPNQPELPDQQLFGSTCNNCHMPTDPDITAVADVEGVPADRKYHDHRFAGVDVQLTPFPDEASAAEVDADQREAIDMFRQNAVCASLCVQPSGAGNGDELVVWLHNEAAGHHWPSGAKQDRRIWVELTAYDANDQILYQTGLVPEGTPVVDVEATDPNMWVLRDKILDESGTEVHMFWEAASYEESHLAVAEDFFGDPLTWAKRVFPPMSETPARVTMHMYLRPMGLEVLDLLVESDDLDPVIRDRMETFEIPNVDLVWVPPDPNDEDAALLSDTYGSCVSSGKVCRSPFINCAFLGSAECELEPTCTWTPPELGSQTGWCSGCGAWTDQASCEQGAYCLWDGATCSFNKCIDELQQGKCEDMTDCGWGGDPGECSPCSTQTQQDCTALTGCAWDAGSCISCAGQDEATCGTLTGCAWDTDACVPG